MILQPRMEMLPANRLSTRPVCLCVLIFYLLNITMYNNNTAHRYTANNTTVYIIHTHNAHCLLPCFIRSTCTHTVQYVHRTREKCIFYSRRSNTYSNNIMRIFAFDSVFFFPITTRLYYAPRSVL